MFTVLPSGKSSVVPTATWCLVDVSKFANNKASITPTAFMRPAKLSGRFALALAFQNSLNKHDPDGINFRNGKPCYSLVCCILK